MLSFAKVLKAAIVARSFLLGTTSPNGFNAGQDRVLSRDDGECPITHGEIEHKPYELKHATLSTRKLSQTSGKNGPWTTTQKMTAGDGAASDIFGSSIALYGNTLVVGAPYDDARGSNSGSVYVFEKSSVTETPWTLSTKLTAGDGVANDEFGWSIALDGTTLVVGNLHDDDSGSGSGSVYVFEKSNVPGSSWTQSTKLTAGDGAADDNFGWFIALEGSTLAVGAPSYYGSGSGAVYVFESEALLSLPPVTVPSPILPPPSSTPPSTPSPSPAPPSGDPSVSDSQETLELLVRISVSDCNGVDHPQIFSAMCVSFLQMTDLTTTGATCAEERSTCTSAASRHLLQSNSLVELVYTGLQADQKQLVDQRFQQALEEDDYIATFVSIVEDNLADLPELLSSFKSVEITSMSAETIEYSPPGTSPATGSPSEPGVDSTPETEDSTENDFPQLNSQSELLTKHMMWIVACCLEMYVMLM